MPDLIQKQPEEKQLAVPTTRFSTKYFFPEQKYTQVQKSTPNITQQNIIAPLNELFSTAPAAQQTILPQSQQTESAFSNIATGARERISALLSFIYLLFSSKYALRRKQGALALKQLKYLAALCSATSSFTNDEALLFNAAFGEAYYNVLQQAKLPHKKNEEQALYLHSSFKSLLRAADSV